MTIPLTERFAVLERDRFTCRFCGKRAPETELEVDHFQPRSKGGTDDRANLVTACRDCNRGKGDRPSLGPAANEWGDLLGLFFHTYKPAPDGHIQKQGRVVGSLGHGYYVVEHFEWLAGTVSWTRHVVTIAQIASEGWGFFRDDEAMRDAYQYSGRRYREPRPAPPGEPETVRLADVLLEMTDDGGGEA